MPVIGWRHAEYSAKRAREVWLIVEPASDGDLRKRQLSGGDEPSRSLQAESQDELMRRQTKRRPEEPRKVKGTDARALCERNQRHIRVEL